MSVRRETAGQAKARRARPRAIERAADNSVLEESETVVKAAE